MYIAGRLSELPEGHEYDSLTEAKERADELGRRGIRAGVMDERDRVIYRAGPSAKHKGLRSSPGHLALDADHNTRAIRVVRGRAVKT